MEEENEGNQHRVLQLLDAWRGGDPAALDALTPLVYRELHRLAMKYMQRERKGHTLQATALVNEAFTRLIRSPISATDSKHFYAIAARLMRRILVDHGKTKARLKRGGTGMFEQLVDQEPFVEPNHEAIEQFDLVQLDKALEILEKDYEFTARVVELRYFGGLTRDETAEVLDVSGSTVDRELRFARAWLLKALLPKDKS